MIRSQLFGGRWGRGAEFALAINQALQRLRELDPKLCPADKLLLKAEDFGQ